MNASQPARVPKGAHDGGQFAAAARAESDVRLAPPFVVVEGGLVQYSTDAVQTFDLDVLDEDVRDGIAADEVAEVHARALSAMEQYEEGSAHYARLEDIVRRCDGWLLSNRESKRHDTDEHGGQSVRSGVHEDPGTDDPSTPIASAPRADTASRTVTTSYGAYRMEARDGKVYLTTPTRTVQLSTDSHGGSLYVYGENGEGIGVMDQDALFSEIAAMHGCATSSARYNVQSGIDRLREQMAEAGFLPAWR